ncbi:MAG: (2Fe-2S)-binding protein [Pseudomonadota bacterium]
MFRRLEARGTGATVTLQFEGRAVTALAGESVASALLAAGLTAGRQTPKTGAPRGPFCMMGTCFECLMVIDGEANRQACQVPVAEGMTVARQEGAAALALDADPVP